jgi:prophage antirepressor-like protein
MNGVIDNKVIKFKVNNSNIVDHVTYVSLVNNVLIENKIYNKLYDIINNGTNKIMVIFDKSNNIFFGMNEILKTLNYGNINNAFGTIKISDNNKVNIKNIDIKTINCSQKNLQPNKIFLNKSGLVELLTNSNKKKSKRYFE